MALTAEGMKSTPEMTKEGLIIHLEGDFNVGPHTITAHFGDNEKETLELGNGHDCVAGVTDHNTQPVKTVLDTGRGISSVC